MTLELTHVRNAEVSAGKYGGVFWNALLDEWNDARIDLPSASVTNGAQPGDVAIAICDGPNVQPARFVQFQVERDRTAQGVFHLLFQEIEQRLKPFSPPHRPHADADSDAQANFVRARHAFAPAQQRGELFGRDRFRRFVIPDPELIKIFA